MRPSPRRVRASRVLRFESVEPRWFLSGDPVARLSLEYLVENQLDYAVQPAAVSPDALTGLDQVRADYGFTGKGQTVVVIDSGIAYRHAALGGGLGPGYRVVGGFDFTGERDADPYDDGPFGSHGTHVAGIIGSSDTNHLGLAPEVSLVGLRVFDDAGQGLFQWVEEALQWVHSHRNSFANPVTTVNLSLGANWNSSTLPDWAILEDEFAQLKADGIFIAVAAGNAFANYNQPGLSYPAASPYVVPIGSVDNDGSLSYYSQRDARMIAAPGRGILSSVPDYAGNGNGVDDDFIRYSGTSMAAPYVAGASVLLRQAYAFAGVNNVTQQTLYDLMYSTADTFFDSATNQSYHRLNIERAIDAIMPTDGYGSTAATAHGLGTLSTGRSLAGIIENLRDQDWFTFTAGASGSVSLKLDAAGGLRPQWQTPNAMRVTKGASGSELSFDVVAGQTYTFGLAADGAIGRYTLNLKLNPTVRYVDWGTIRQATFAGQQIRGDGQWFTITAAQNAILTTEALFAQAAGDVDLELFDANGQLVGSSYGSLDSERIDVTATAGQTFHLRAFVYGGGANNGVSFRVTNLVTRVGDALSVTGTDGNDTFRFTAGAASHLLSINGVAYQFQVNEVRAVTFDGRAGADTATLTGAAGNDTAVLRVGSAELSGTGYRAATANVENVVVLGGGGANHALFYDSVGNDNFVATPGYGGMFGPGYSNQARGFQAIEAWATAGGTDVAKLYDSAGDDLFTATPDYGRLSGNGFGNEARGFDAVHAFATAGGTDEARLYDSAGNDTLVASPGEAALFGRGFYNRAKFFETVQGSASAGGTDRAYLRALAATDLLQASTGQARLLSGNTATRLGGFDYVRATAAPGAANKAELSAVDYILEFEGLWT